MSRRDPFEDFMAELRAMADRHPDIVFALSAVHTGLNKRTVAATVPVDQIPMLFREGLEQATQNARAASASRRRSS